MPPGIYGIKAQEEFKNESRNNAADDKNDITNVGESKGRKFLIMQITNSETIYFEHTTQILY